jgi:hypothetical protein
MNFQGPKDFTPDIKRYQKVIAFLLYIQNSYPIVFEMLLQTPQFEYEVEACRYRKQWARQYLSTLKNLVKQYDIENHTTIYSLKHQKSHLPVLGDNVYQRHSNYMT